MSRSIIRHFTSHLRPTPLLLVVGLVVLELPVSLAHTMQSGTQFPAATFNAPDSFDPSLTCSVQ
jgi:hypothetical protein